ncbi:type II toxin-antitoxin system RelE/ParE family toxin [Kushneria aurantia]|uniref:Type II toxin-antitoxin system RelE/ParE family toxin n=1 Tax=Kushneria aurantia TaxID=504092 RepID=A0ABV6G612_9GAMM|nr:type II toxin-antitoxin system RelE/ParE family toxin [Kushneria aurantia]
MAEGNSEPANVFGRAAAAETVARIIYAARALADLERVTEFLLETDSVAASQTVGLITTAIETLEDHPLIGRTYSPEVRELFISRGRTGYVALYRFLPGQDLVAILSIRHPERVAEKILGLIRSGERQDDLVPKAFGGSLEA